MKLKKVVSSAVAFFMTVTGVFNTNTGHGSQVEPSSLFSHDDNAVLLRNRPSDIRYGYGRAGFLYILADDDYGACICLYPVSAL